MEDQKIRQPVLAVCRFDTAIQQATLVLDAIREAQQSAFNFKTQAMADEIIGPDSDPGTAQFSVMQAAIRCEEVRMWLQKARDAMGSVRPPSVGRKQQLND